MDAPSDYDLLYEQAVPLLISSQHQINDDTTTGGTVSLSQSAAVSEDMNSGNKFDFPAMIRRSSSRSNLPKMAANTNAKDSKVRPLATLKKQVCSMFELMVRCHGLC